MTDSDRCVVCPSFTCDAVLVCMGLGFSVYRLGMRVEGLGVRVWDLRFRVGGFGSVQGFRVGV